MDKPLENYGLELQAQQLFVGWTRHFREQDAALRYTTVEQARILPLSPSLVLVGIVDAEGTDFFSEFKTANPRGAKTWKREWLLSTQALTYGLLTGGTKRFLVRKAFKAATPFYDHEWFEFSPADLFMWRTQIELIAEEIHEYKRHADPVWPLNITHGCFAYGPNYPCPFWADGCTKHNFDGPIPGSIPFADFPEFEGANRAILETAMKTYPNALFLSKTRIEQWHRCREFYRRSQTMNFPPSDAMLLGSRLHSLVAAYNAKFIGGTP